MPDRPTERTHVPSTRASPDVEQFDRAHEPERRRAMDRDGPIEAMRSEHQSFAGAAEGIGSVGYDDPGAYDVVAATRARLNQATSAGPVGDDLGGAPAPNVTGEVSGARAESEADEMRAQATKEPSKDWHEL
jgi:hypothetical protein